MSATACAAPPCLAAAWLPLRCPARRRSHGAPGVAPCGGPPQLSCGAGVRDAAVAGEEEEEERLCRYCFEGAEAGELISPCRCMGGQKWVHLACLRRWQRTVLVSQPTHPDLYDNDTRQRVCNVCKAEFSTPPPSRQELLASFTGSELAALIEEGCVIGSAEDFSEELERQVSAFPESVRETVVCRNWIRGVFLIVKVVQDRDRHAVHLTLNEDDDRARLLVQLGNDSRTLHVRGRRFVVMPQGPLQGLEEDSPPELWRNAIGALETPVTLQLRLGPVADCGEDGIVAVNLTRPVDLSRSRPPLDHSEAWGTIYPRLVFAPRSEMSESYDGHAPEEEERRRELRRMAIFQDIIRRRPGDLPRPRGREAAEADGADGAPSESEGENLPQVWSSEAEHDEAEDEDLEEDEEVDEAEVAGPEPEEMPNEDPGEWQSRWLSDDQDWLAVSE